MPRHFETLRFFEYLKFTFMKTTLLSILFLFLLQGCVQLIAIRTVGGIMDYGFEAFNEEADLQLAQESLGSNLKLIEALLKGDPENEKLLLLAARGYSSYSLAFVEEESLERARFFYLRARDFGLRILNHNAKFHDALPKGVRSFQNALSGFGKNDVPAVFWTAFAWGSYINADRSDISALADLWKVNALMAFVLEKDPGYYYGGGYLFFGTIEGSMPPMLGGKPEQAKAYFEKCLEINEGKFLMTYVYYASTYAVQIQDRDLFISLLKKAIDTPLDVLPEARLPNAVAKRKAERLLSRVDELF